MYARVGLIGGGRTSNIHRFKVEPIEGHRTCAKVTVDGQQRLCSSYKIEHYAGSLPMVNINLIADVQYEQDAEIYQQMAVDDISGKSNFKQDSEKLIAEYKKCKREREISKAIKELKQSYEKKYN